MISGTLFDFSQYTDLKWQLVPIKPGSKGSNRMGWNLRENTVTDPRRIPLGEYAGICHAYSGTMALDIDDWDLALIEMYNRGLNLYNLFDAPDAVSISSGRPGHAKLLYKMPVGLILQSKKIIHKDAFGATKNIIDFRCATDNGRSVQDVLPPAINPISRQPYTWQGRGHFSKLPEIPLSLLTIWLSLLPQEQNRFQAPVKRSHMPTDVHENAEWSDIMAAIGHLDPDMSRDEWLTVGMALHYEGTRSNRWDGAFTLWDKWSQGSKYGKYKGRPDCLRVWNSFEIQENSVKIGTLYKMARDAGWIRPDPDISGIFAQGIQPTDPQTLIDGLRYPPPRLDVDLFPLTLAQRAKEISRSVGCDPLIPLLAGLAVISAVADSRIRLELASGYLVPPVLWLMTIGSPGDKKSPGSRPMFKILKALEAEDRPRHAMEEMKWQAVEAAHKSSKIAHLKAAEKPEIVINPDSGEIDYNDLPGVVRLPARPAELILSVQDVTSQRLVRLASDRPRGMLLELDEMNTWVSRLASPHSGEDRSCWVSGYESEPYRLNRQGDGKGTSDAYCANFAISIYGNIQPRVFKEFLPNLSRDGLLQRFIPGVLSGEYDTVPKDIPDFLTNVRAWETLVRHVYSLTPMVYRLSPEARRSFETFREWYYRAKQDERLVSASDTFMTAFGKIEGTLGRLTLIYHLMVDQYNLQVSGNTMNHCIKIVKEYVIPALRYSFGEIGGSVDEGMEKTITEYVAQVCLEKQHITIGDLKYVLRKQLANVNPWMRDQQVMDAVHTLEDHHWLKRFYEADQRAGLVVWMIDPRVPTAFREYRSQVVKAKQRRLDEQMAKCFPDGSQKRRFVAGYDPKIDDDVGK